MYFPEHLALGSLASSKTVTPVCPAMWKTCLSYPLRLIKSHRIPSTSKPKKMPCLVTLLCALASMSQAWAGSKTTLETHSLPQRELEMDWWEKSQGTDLSLAQEFGSLAAIARQCHGMQLG